MIPRDCVGSVWSRRDKNENKHQASSVKATVNQFNAVSRRVLTTVLFGEYQGSPSIMRRAKRLETWIEIAQVCKNNSFHLRCYFWVSLCHYAVNLGGGQPKLY